jgi:hypothetical protein
MRCRITTIGDVEGFSADIRSMPMDADSSMCGGANSLDDEGNTALVVPDDINEGKTAYVILIGPDGGLVSQLVTTVGED